MDSSLISVGHGNLNKRINYVMSEVGEFSGGDGEIIAQWIRLVKVAYKRHDIVDDVVKEVVRGKLRCAALEVVRQHIDLSPGTFCVMENVLKNIFIIDASTAFEKFVSRKMGVNELFDCYFAGMRELVEYFGGIK